MEDGMINGATMLDALLIKIEKENDLDAICFAKKIVKGMLDTALASNEEGFIPRAVCVADGKTHYTDSSRDQYTMFAFAMHRYFNSKICSKEGKDKINKVAVSVAQKR